MVLSIPMILTRPEFEKIAKTFSDPSVNEAAFDLKSNIKAIRFDSEYHNLVCGTEIESVSARVDLK